MAQQHLDFGSPADADGETPYTAWPKVEENFTELFSRATALEDNVRTVAKGGTGASTATNARINLYAAPFDAMAYSGLQVNGFHQVSQENGDTAVGNGGYPSDQNLFSLTHAATATAKRVASPFSSRLDIPRGIEIETTSGASAAAGNFLVLSQRIEGERVRGRLAWGTAAAKPLRIGAVLRSNVSGRGYLSVTNSAQNRTHLKAFDLVAGVDAWANITVPGDTSGTWLQDTGIGLRVQWCFSAGSTFHGTANVWNASNVFAASDITNFAATTGNKIWLGPLVVLPGSELPTFAEVMACQRHHDDELRTCQRYWQPIQQGSFHGRWFTTTAATVFGQFPVAMRGGPSAALVATAGRILEPLVAFRDIVSIGGAALSVTGGYFDLVTATANAGAPSSLRDGAITLNARM